MYIKIIKTDDKICFINMNRIEAVYECHNEDVGIYLRIDTGDGYYWTYESIGNFMERLINLTKENSNE